jgi:hypothetical protein
LPIAGSQIYSIWDGTATFTDANGQFYLKTTLPGSWYEDELEISATGYTTINRYYGGNGLVSGLQIYLSPLNTLTLDNSLNNLSGAIGSQTFYKITIPAGLTSLQISISGGTGDCDLYVKFGSPPTLYSWDYYPGLDGNNEDVNISNPTAGDWYIMLNGYNNYSGVTLLAQ